MTFCKVMHKNNLKYAGELASLSIPQIILVYDAPLDNSSAAKPPAIQYFPRVKLF